MFCRIEFQFMQEKRPQPGQMSENVPAGSHSRIERRIPETENSGH